MTIAPEQFPATFDDFLFEMKRRIDVDAFENEFKKTLDAANKNPVTLYKFVHDYNYLNAQIASTIASLVGNIGKSRHAFLDPSIEVVDEADFSFEVAEQVKQASTNEYSDPDYRDQNEEGLSHRLLATGLLKSIGDYAGLSPAQRGKFTIDPWLENRTDEIQQVYSGEKDNLEKLCKGIGAHIFSEWSADNVEFSNTAKALFVDAKGRGYDVYFNEHRYITVQGKSFLANSWLKTHGGYNEETGTIDHAAEYVHLQSAYKAAKIVIDRLPPEQKRAAGEAIFRGMVECRLNLIGFFMTARMECEEFRPELIR